MNNSTKLLIGAGAVLALAGVAYFVARKGAAALNPLSDKNVAYSGVNSLGAALTGNDSFDLGGAIYDALHYEYDPNDPNSPPPGTSIFNPAALWNRITGDSGSKVTTAAKPLAQPILAAPGDSRSEYVTIGSTEAPTPYTSFDLDRYLGITSKTDPRYNWNPF